MNQVLSLMIMSTFIFPDDEVNVEDFDKWFPLIQLHAQMVGDGPDEIAKIKDDFCLLAVKNSLNEHKNKFKIESVNYNLHPMNNEFLQSVSELAFFCMDVKHHKIYKQNSKFHSGSSIEKIYEQCE